MCRKHYRKHKASGEILSGQRPRGSLESRFWPKVAKADDDSCWEWTAGKSKNGYGVIQEGGKGSALLSAHRVSYELAKGPIGAGLYVLHSCDNRGCVNPNHLRAGTGQENIQEAYDKGRKVSPFTKPENRYRG